MVDIFNFTKQKKEKLQSRAFEHGECRINSQGGIKWAS